MEKAEKERIWILICPDSIAKIEKMCIRWSLFRLCCVLYYDMICMFSFTPIFYF